MLHNHHHITRKLLESNLCFQSLLYEASIIIIPKPDKDISRKKTTEKKKEKITKNWKKDKNTKRKLQTCIFPGYRCRNLQQNISRSNLTMYKKRYVPELNCIYSRYARLIWYFKRISQCIHQQQAKEEKIRWSYQLMQKKAFNKIQHLIQDENSQQIRNREEIPQLDF